MTRLSQATGAIAAALLFAIGAMLTFEVTARCFFNAPTVWAEELSRLFLIWAVFMASAAMIRSGDHIRVTVLIDRAPPLVRRIADAASYLFVAIISALVAWHGVPIAAQSFEVGRTTGSMLDIPQWWSQAAIPLGFALITIEALMVALARLVGEDAPAPSPGAHE